jgi:hypothetical protein
MYGRMKKDHAKMVHAWGPGWRRGGSESRLCERERSGKEEEGVGEA